MVINYLPQQRKRYCRTPANQSQHSITTFGDILWVWKIFFFFVLVYIYGFLLQRWEVLMRVHEPLPPDNKYLSTKPINTVIAGARTDLLVIMPSGCFRIRPSQPPANPSICCTSSGFPKRRSKSTETPSMGTGPIRGRNTQHNRLFLDQPSSALPGVVFQLTEGYRCEVKRPLAVCWEDCCFLLYWTWVTRSHNDRGCFIVWQSHQFSTANLFRRSKDDCKCTTFWTGC